MSSGQNIIISGTGFGATGPTVVLFDDFETGSDGAAITTVPQSTVGSWQGVTPADPYSNYSSTHRRSGNLSFHQDWSDYEGSRWLNADLNGTTAAYVSFWLYLPIGSDIPGTNSAGANWKVFSLGYADLNTDYTPTFLSNTLPMPTAGAGTWGIQTWHDGTGRICDTSEEFAAPTAFENGVWTRYEAYITANATNGVVQLWETNENQARTQTQFVTGNTVNTGEDTWNYAHFPAFGRNDEGSDTYYDDIYIATGTGARARVEIGNASTYAACTNLAVCTPTSWGASSITATVRTGSFTTGTAYLYVTDSDGATNSTGYEITLSIVTRKIGGNPPR